MRIVSNGNNYSDEWPVEAAKRGLLNLRITSYNVCYTKLLRSYGIVALSSNSTFFAVLSILTTDFPRIVSTLLSYNFV